MISQAAHYLFSLSFEMMPVKEGFSCVKKCSIGHPEQAILFRTNGILNVSKFNFSLTSSQKRGAATVASSFPLVE